MVPSNHLGPYFTFCFLWKIIKRILGPSKKYLVNQIRTLFGFWYKVPWGPRKVGTSLTKILATPLNMYLKY